MVLALTQSKSLLSPLVRELTLSEASIIKD